MQRPLSSPGEPRSTSVSRITSYNVCYTKLLRITGIVEPGTPEYSQINSDAKVIARFTAADWETDEDGYNVIVYHVKNLDKNTYYRLRGTNLPVGTPGQSDELGNPTLDLDGPLKGAEETWTDMWFYSNPIFVYVD